MSLVNYFKIFLTDIIFIIFNTLTYFYYHYYKNKKRNVKILLDIFLITGPKLKPKKMLK